MIESNRLRDGVHRAYSAAADRPQAEHPFPVGRAFAEKLGYPADVLDRFPLAAEAFAGVSNVAVFANLPPGAAVLDLGCGAGLDSLIAAGRVGAAGRVVGVDFSESMLARATQAAAGSGGGMPGAGRLEFKRGDAERIPLDDASVDVALVNGIFNLNPARGLIFGELARVVRPGGEVYAAEIILREPLPPGEQASDSDWFA